MTDETQTTDEIQTMSLPTLGNGAACELFEDELKRVLENILDVNTDAEATRSVTLKMTVKPDADREGARVLLEASSKIAPQMGVGTAMFIGKQAGQAVAVEHNPKQLQLQLDKGNPVREFTAASDD